LRHGGAAVWPGGHRAGTGGEGKSPSRAS
ncbi:hypothetical protein A2U01_0059201, partial [Trifolium medium]|nr:hypothetical protein [Trifolium medium]